MLSNQSGSRRWTHFHSALQLAIQRSAHKWTYVKVHCSSARRPQTLLGLKTSRNVFRCMLRKTRTALQPHLTVYPNTLKRRTLYVLRSNLARETLIFLQRDLDKLFKDYNVQENVDILHKVVTDAKERKASGTVGKSVWKDNLDSRVAVAARTVPLLTSEADRLRALTAQVRTLRVFFNPFLTSFRSMPRIVN